MAATPLPPPADDGAPTLGRPARRALRGARRRLALPILGAALLGACATGNADDAGPAATEEAKATNVISALEATYVVEQFFQPTPTPLPYATRLPVLANLRVTSDVGDQNRPADQLTVYDRSGPLYAAAQINSLHPGQVVAASWQDAQGNEVGSSTVDIDNDRELVWIALRWDGAGAAPSGSYAVVISVRGPGTGSDGTPRVVNTEIGSITFRIQ